MSQCACGCGNQACETDCSCGGTLNYVVHNESGPVKYSKGTGWREPPAALPPTPRGSISGGGPSANVRNVPEFKQIDAEADAARTSTPPKHNLPRGSREQKIRVANDNSERSRKIRVKAAQLVAESEGRQEWETALSIAEMIVDREGEKYSRARAASQPQRYTAADAERDIADIERQLDAALAGPRREMHDEAYRRVSRKIDQAARNGVVLDTKGLLQDEMAKLEAKRYGRGSVTPDDVVAYATRQIERGRCISYADAQAELCGA